MEEGCNRADLCQQIIFELPNELLDAVFSCLAPARLSHTKSVKSFTAEWLKAKQVPSAHPTDLNWFIGDFWTNYTLSLHLHCWLKKKCMPSILF